MRPAPRLRAVLIAVAAALFAIGCGGDDDSSSGDDVGPSDASLTVVALDIDFEQDAYEVDAGAIEFVYENEGNIIHTLLIEGEPFELSVRSNGDVDRGVIELEPGEYSLFCDVPGHRPAGMVATLTVR